jgi:phosphotransferase system  glucose/maltose/N-acetylglucosamine-specific IIC component
MFEDLNWANAFKRAAVFTGIWLALVYVMNIAFPGSFGVQGNGGLLTIAAYALIFFVLYAVVFAFVERRRNQLRAGASRKRDRPGKPTEENGEAPAYSLKGKYNPNTSRRKARRRR